MKNVILLGANGASAREIIPRVLEQEDVRLTLFLLRPNRLGDVRSSRIDLFDGDARNIDHLREAIKGHDIVINTMGGMDLDLKTANVVRAMKEVGSRRLIAINAGGIFDELPEPFNAWDKGMVGHTRPVNLATARLIEESSLCYTILRPVWLTDKPTEIFQLTQKGDIYKGTETSRASLGRFVANVVANPELHSNENLGISQPDTDGNRPAAYR